MRYSLGAATTTALLATSTLSLALPTASSLFNLQDSSLSVPAVAEKVFGSVGSWLSNAEKNVHDTVKGMQVSKLVQDGVDCERTPTICFIPPLIALLIFLSSRLLWPFPLGTCCRRRPHSPGPSFLPSPSHLDVELELGDGDDHAPPL